MPASDLVVKGARQHNLRDVNLVLPSNQLICFTGVSGSGKSSLAFDTLYAEGQRRYVESLSTYARQFLGQMPKPDVDFIGGLRPSISISQKTAGSNPRSTVGTITEIYDYLRVLYARVGTGHCPHCGRAVAAQSREQILQQILSLSAGTRFVVLAPLIRGQKGEYRDLCEDLRKQGFGRARVDGRIVSLADDWQLDRQMRHEIEVVIDRLVMQPGLRPRLAEAVELALKMGQGTLVVSPLDDEAPSPAGVRGAGRPTAGGRGPAGGKRREPLARELVLSADYACAACGVSFSPPSPQLFSFNSPQGMCPVCDGLGEQYTIDPELLMSEPQRSLREGCCALIGAWRELGRWRRHIYQGVADTVERQRGLAAGVLLDTPWAELDPALQRLWLWGTGQEHITFTWRGGSAPIKYGGTFPGIIPDLLARYRGTKSRLQAAQLEKYMRTVRCPACQGARLNPQARAMLLTSRHPAFADRPQRSLPELCGLSVAQAVAFCSDLALDETRGLISVELLKEVQGRLGFLMNVGLDYLTLDRTAPTLSGGESQRIRLAGQIGCGLVGVLYILDEPSIGLHPRDNQRLLATLRHLRDMGNTVVVVEHDEETMRAADQIVDFGPGPGVRGGEIVAQGPASALTRSSRSLTGDYLAGRKSIEVPARRRLPEAAPRHGQPAPRARRERSPGSGPQHVRPLPAGVPVLSVLGARHNNLRDIDVHIPLGALVCVTGVSGSGKSSLVNDILVEALRRDLNGGEGQPGAHRRIEGREQLDKLIAIDQSPIGRTPRSNAGTYIKVLDDIRRLYSQLPEAKRRGYRPGRFSFNVDGGRCQACEGNGANRLEMDFLADVWVTCPVCEGHRFNRETLGVRFKEQSISDVLEMDVQQALVLFENIPDVRHKLQTLHDVGLDYLKLGQPSPTLSGGEAQRIKLARQLVMKSRGRTLYLLDEPTTGLHFADIQLLLSVLHGFVDAGHTVLIVEHNLDVVKTADWIIDLGPEGGDAGGQVVATGTPEQLAACDTSHTGRALAAVLASAGGERPTPPGRLRPAAARRAAGTVQRARHIHVQGARQHNLKDVEVQIPRDRMTVCCGPSGSGKSSLAMDTVYAEGQRRYVESLSAYARQFVSQMQKPQLDHIEGLSPAIAIEQHNLGSTPRSTVGTTTEIYDYLRILMARLGTPHCPDCELAIGTQSADEIIDKVLDHPEGTELHLLAPARVDAGQDYETLWEEFRGQGFVRVRIDGQTCALDNPPPIDRRRRHNVQLVLDRIVVRGKNRSRIAESVEAALALGRGMLHLVYPQEAVPEPRWPTVVHSQHLACGRCGRSFERLSPQQFSFNSPLGWCPACEGLGTQTGANPAALLREERLSLGQGAVALWPNLDRQVSQWMLAALSAGSGIPQDQPLDQLSPRQRRLLLYGTGETWLDVWPPGAGKRRRGRPLFRFQFKGLYPALEEAARLSPGLRGRLEHLTDEVECAACGGSRLRDDAAAVRFRGRTLDAYGRLPLGQLHQVVDQWRLSARERKIAGELIHEVCSRVRFLNDVGLEYLTLSRPTATLSGGEAQRIRLGSQLGSGLCGVLYVLDEPTIGLHPRDNRRLIAALHKLRDLGNTLLLVEHDREVIRSADAVLDFGPGAGRHGGQVVARGRPAQLGRLPTSVTGPYLAGKKAIPIPANRRPSAARRPDAAPADTNGAASPPAAANRAGRDGAQPSSGPPPAMLEIVGARHHNLRNVDVQIPLGTLTAVTGVSGSGKSSLVDDVLYAVLARTLHRAQTLPGQHTCLRGVEQINKVIRVDQQPLGNSPSSNPATYTGVFDLVRELFAQLPQAKLRGYTPRRFSFNVPGGRCEPCEGNGQRCIEMHFLPDVWVPCEACQAKRYNPETLEVIYHGRSIADVLELTCRDARELFDNIPKIRRILETLCAVGLEYLTLGQPAPTLSGGEAQRVKLAAELARPDTGRTLYLLDEPTTGLHFDDLARLLDVLQRLVDLGNTVVVIEHNLDVIKSADWVIDLGPEAGADGGRVVIAGTPEQVAEYAQRVARQGAARAARRAPAPGAAPPDRSYTGEALHEVLAAGPYRPRPTYDFQADQLRRPSDLEIAEVGREARMPWQIDGPRWHTRDRVGRDGQPCRWDGRILAQVVERVQQLGTFSETNWDARSIVEIAAPRKSDGWFLHALTGETWLLKLKFRVTRKTFQQEVLQQQLPLKPLNEMHHLPLYGNRPRVRCKQLRGPWQEVQIHVHAWDEIDTPDFWQFLEQAVRSFMRYTQRVASSPEEMMPWKVLGEKWHLSRKGFPPGKPAAWDVGVLEAICRLLRRAVPEAQFLWTQQQVVHVSLPGREEPWASLHTKRPGGLDLLLSSPPGRFALGRAAALAGERHMETGADRDVLHLRFRSLRDLAKGDLPEFLQEHANLLSAAQV